MTNRAEFERLLDVYGFRCERFGQDLSTHARAQVVSAFAALASAPVADESPMAKVADALREKGRQEQQAYQDSRVQSTEWGPMPHGTEADLPASAPVAGEAQPANIKSRRPTGVLSMHGASLHMKPDGSGEIIVAEDDFTLEDDRDEGPDGPQGSVHWVARLPASEIAALRNFLTGHARPSDDALWDQTLAERDEYHDAADKLANAIAGHLLVEIGEHTSSNCPWMRALEAIENAAPQASAEDVRKPIMTVAEFCTEADRIGLTADTLAAQLAQRPEFADCLPQADKDGGQQRAGDVDVTRLLAAAKGMTKLYGNVWDRTDGALVVFPENVARFDAAFDALRAAVGEVVDDATQPEQGERDE